MYAPAKTVAVSVYPDFLRELDEFAQKYNMPRSRALEFIGRHGLEAVRSREGA